KKAEFAATAAICGAALIHVISMVLLVGILGSWLVSITPPAITEIAQIYILPSILGGVTVQLIATLKQVRATVIALAAAALVVFVLVPLVPALDAVSIALAVVITIIATWFLRPASMRGARSDGGAGGDGSGGGGGGRVGINCSPLCRVWRPARKRVRTGPVQPLPQARETRARHGARHPRSPARRPREAVRGARRPGVSERPGLSPPDPRAAG